MYKHCWTYLLCVCPDLITEEQVNEINPLYEHANLPNTSQTFHDYTLHGQELRTHTQTDKSSNVYTWIAPPQRR
jgi:hypothetical protein